MTSTSPSPTGAACTLRSGGGGKRRSAGAFAILVAVAAGASGMPLNETFSATLTSSTLVTPSGSPFGGPDTLVDESRETRNLFEAGEVTAKTSVPTGDAASTGGVTLRTERSPGFYRTVGDAVFSIRGEEAGVNSRSDNRLELNWSFDLEEEMDFTLDLGVGGQLLFTPSLASTTFRGERTGLIVEASQRGGMPSLDNGASKRGVLAPDRYTLETTLTAVGETPSPFGGSGYGIRNAFGSTLTLSVPEPTAGLSLLAGGALLLRRRPAA